MTAFFVPGIADDARASEDAYGKMRRQTELEQGHPPSARRIFSLWTRRGAVDCVTEVGSRDPLHGGTVIAIFDMGRHLPYVVWREQEAGNGDGVSEAVGCTAYTVQEFDA